MARPSNLSLTIPAPALAGFALATLCAALALEARPARAEDLIVRYDQSQLLRLPRPVAEVIVGNPSIADVSIQGGNLLVVTGKTFGMTNIIALDAERNIIQDQRIQVERDHHNVVHLHRGAVRNSYSCVPSCAPMLAIGDEAAFFQQVLAQNTSKTKFSEAQTEKEGQQ
jgi:Flp pilus assembly secretin CpaC